MGIWAIVLTSGAVLFVVMTASTISAPFIMLLWNWLCPVLFGVQEIGFLQAWGLSFLCGILFKGNVIVDRSS